MSIMCQKHWDQMRGKLNQLSVVHTAARTVEEAIAILQAMSQQGRTQLDDSAWDPLLAMYCNFVNRVFASIGFFIGCPLCIVREDFDVHDTPSRRCDFPDCDIELSPNEEPWDLQWINSCANVMREEAVKRGLVRVS